MHKDQIKNDIQAGIDEFARLKKAVEKFNDKSNSLPPSDDEIWNLKNSIAMVLQSVYTGFENSLERIIKHTDGPQKGVPESHHKMVLERASNSLENVRSAIISKNLKIDLIHLLGFRHVVRKKYAQELDFKKSMDNYLRAEKALPQFKMEIDAFLDSYFKDNDVSDGANMRNVQKSKGPKNKLKN